MVQKETVMLGFPSTAQITFFKPNNESLNMSSGILSTVYIASAFMVKHYWRVKEWQDLKVSVSRKNSLVTLKKGQFTNYQDLHISWVFSDCPFKGTINLYGYRGIFKVSPCFRMWKFNLEMARNPNKICFLARWNMPGIDFRQQQKN